MDKLHTRVLSKFRDARKLLPTEEQNLQNLQKTLDDYKLKLNNIVPTYRLKRQGPGKGNIVKQQIIPVEAIEIKDKIRDIEHDIEILSQKIERIKNYEDVNEYNLEA